MSEGERCLCLAFDNLQLQLQLLSALSEWSLAAEMSQKNLLSLLQVQPTTNFSSHRLVNSE